MKCIYFEINITVVVPAENESNDEFPNSVARI